MCCVDVTHENHAFHMLEDPSHPVFGFCSVKCGWLYFLHLLSICLPPIERSGLLGMGNFWTMVFNKGAGFCYSWGLHLCNSLCWKYRYIYTHIHRRIADIHKPSTLWKLILEFSCLWLVQGMKLISKFLWFSVKCFSKMSISVRSCFTCFIWFEFALEGYIQMQSWISHRSHLHQGIPIS